MMIKDIALSLNRFDASLAKMPNNGLKQALKQHVHDAYQLLLEECLQRNAARHHYSPKTREKVNDNPHKKPTTTASNQYMKSS